jgi:hypothetical protein
MMGAQEIIPILVLGETKAVRRTVTVGLGGFEPDGLGDDSVNRSQNTEPEMVSRI